MSDLPHPDARAARTLDEELIAAELPTVVGEYTDAERVERMRAELDMGFKALAGLQGVSIFGSARIPESDPDYALAREVGARLGQAGFCVITGGGPGIMEAANRGAHNVGAGSVGLNIELPFEQAPNPYQTLELTFHYFFTRKVMFVRYACAFVVFPGGFGTLDEFFEALVLIQTDKIADFPVVLVGTAFWGGLLDWVRDQLQTRSLIGPKDLGLVRVCDDVDEIVEICRRATARQWGTDDAKP
jgi:uncharacterized protein (TIGR00730 family)